MEKVTGSFDNYTARNALIFCVDNSSSSHIDNPKNNFYYQEKDQLKVLIVKLVQQKKKLH